jgi:AcrR family transcriptional regulator
MLPLACQDAARVGKDAMNLAPETTRLNRREASEVMRATLLDAAAGILATEGFSKLTARRLSAAADASTKVVYSHFGGMPGVVTALYDRGFSKLAAELSLAAETAKPNEVIPAIGRAYRAFSCNNTDLFDLMYGPQVAILLPTSDARTIARSALDVLIKAFSNQNALGAEDHARSFWAAIHGVVALERGGWFDEYEAESRLFEVVTCFQKDGR